MARLIGTIRRPDLGGPFDAYYRNAVQVSEQAALLATDRAAAGALSRFRSEMQAAGLGRLGNALGSSSDLKRGGVHRFGVDGFSASGVVYVRTRSERTLGAIEAYTEDANIRPNRGRYLWIATDDIPRVTGRYRMTPELYRKNGFERKIGPLIFARSASGTPLLIAKNIGLSEAGKSRSARSLTNSGRARKGQYAVPAIVAFFGIPHTARAARVDARAIMEQARAELPELYRRAMGR